MLRRILSYEKVNKKMKNEDFFLISLRRLLSLFNVYPNTIIRQLGFPRG